MDTNSRSRLKEVKIITKIGRKNHGTRYGHCLQHVQNDRRKRPSHVKCTVLLIHLTSAIGKIALGTRSQNYCGTAPLMDYGSYHSTMRVTLLLEGTP